MHHSIAFLMDSAVKATAVLAAAFVIAVAIRKSSAAARYLLWTFAIAAILAIPVLSALLPGWSVRVRAAAQPAATSLQLAPAEGMPAAEDISAAQSRQPPPAAGWIIGIWLAGAAAMLARLGIGHFRLWLTARGAALARSAEWRSLAGDLSARIGLRRPVALRQTGETDIPLTCGVFRATVLLPESSREWDAERRAVVLLHELTHVKRWDSLAYGMARLAAALYWFHPLAWLALSHFRREQERSCDDAVIVAGTACSAYARHLVELARSLTPGRTCPPALAMAAAGDLEPRVRALLDPGRKRNAPGKRARLAAISCVAAIVIPLAAMRAQESRPTASLSGVVFDASGAAIPGARILLENVDGANVEVARSGDDGVYKLSAVPAGTYRMHAGAPGLAEMQKTIVLAPGAVEQMNVTLDVGQVTDAMEVLGKGPRPHPVAQPKRIRVGGNVQATKLLTSVPPAYPAGAQAAGIEGTVLIRAVISIQGGLLNLSVINKSVDPELAKAALDAVRQWRYRPTLLNGTPVEVVTTIAVRFRLEP